MIKREDYQLWHVEVVDDDPRDHYTTVVWATCQANAGRLAIAECMAERELIDSYSVDDYETFDEAVARFNLFATAVWAVSPDCTTICPRCESLGKDVGLGWKSCGACGLRWHAHEDEADCLEAIKRDAERFAHIDERFAQARAEVLADLAEDTTP